MRPKACVLQDRHTKDRYGDIISRQMNKFTKHYLPTLQKKPNPVRFKPNNFVTTTFSDSLYIFKR